MPEEPTHISGGSREIAGQSQKRRLLAAENSAFVPMGGQVRQFQSLLWLPLLSS